MKKIILLGLFLSLFLTSGVYANAVATEQKITLDGQEIKIEGYNIDGNNYFKLRDLASYLKETNVKFNVSFNSEKNSVEISKQADYIDDEEKSDVAKKDLLVVKKSNQAVFVDKEERKISAYLINNNNFYKLRDLGQTIGFYVDFDKDKNTVIIKSQKIESKDLIEREEIKFISLASELKSNSKYFKIGDKPNLKIDNFTNIAKSIVMLTSKNTQLSAKAEYIATKNEIILRPLQFKYKGELTFKPILKISSQTKTEFVELKENSIDFDEVTKNIDKNEEFSLILGYYVGEALSQNFRGLSSINFK